jgi:hypothetical protein
MLTSNVLDYVASAVVLLAQVVYATNSTQVNATRPWLDTSLPTEERLQLLVGQWNESQIYAMVQGDTVVSTPPQTPEQTNN